MTDPPFSRTWYIIAFGINLFTIAMITVGIAKATEEANVGGVLAYLAFLVVIVICAAVNLVCATEAKR